MAHDLAHANAMCAFLSVDPAGKLISPLAGIRLRRMMRWLSIACAFTLGLAVVSAASGGGPYAGLTQTRAKQLGAEDLAVERISKGVSTEKQSASLIEKLERSSATFARVKCLVLPRDAGVIVGGSVPPGLKLKPYWRVAFSRCMAGFGSRERMRSPHARETRIATWCSQTRSCTECREKPRSRALSRS